MKKTRRLNGFTLIELIIVIIIIAILAVTVVPKFIDLKYDAENATIKQLVASLNTARTFFVAKILTCNLSYPGIDKANLGFFVKLDGTGGPMECDGPWHTFEIESVRKNLAMNPNENILVSPRQLVIHTKSGRTITITQDSDSNEINWSSS